MGTLIALYPDGKTIAWTLRHDDPDSVEHVQEAQPAALNLSVMWVGENLQHKNADRDVLVTADDGSHSIALSPPPIVPVDLVARKRAQLARALIAARAGAAEARRFAASEQDAIVRAAVALEADKLDTDVARLRAAIAGVA